MPGSTSKEISANPWCLGKTKEESDKRSQRGLILDSVHPASFQGPCLYGVWGPYCQKAILDAIGYDLKEKKDEKKYNNYPSHGQGFWDLESFPLLDLY